MVIIGCCGGFQRYLCFVFYPLLVRVGGICACVVGNTGAQELSQRFGQLNEFVVKLL